MMGPQSDPEGQDGRYLLILRGTGPMGAGASVEIALGAEIVCGRSRHCDWSLKRTPAFLGGERGRRDALRRSLPWRATSRRHCRIAYVAPDMVEVFNESTNGTFVDGHRADRMVLTDCRERCHRLQLGPDGVVLELGPRSLCGRPAEGPVASTDAAADPQPS